MTRLHKANAERRSGAARRLLAARSALIFVETAEEAEAILFAGEEGGVD